MRLFLIAMLGFAFIACEHKAEEAPKPDNAAQVSKLYSAFAEGNVDAVLAGLTDDVQWHEAENFIYYKEGGYVGKDAIVEGVFGRLGAEWEYWNLADLNIENVGTNQALATGRYQAKHKATGNMLDAQFAHVWTMRDTLVMNFQQYTDTKQSAAVIMPNEPDADEGEGDEGED